MMLAQTSVECLMVTPSESSVLLSPSTQYVHSMYIHYTSSGIVSYSNVLVLKEKSHICFKSVHNNKKVGSLYNNGFVVGRDVMLIGIILEGTCAARLTY